MSHSAFDSDLTLSSRYECKYLVSPMVVSEMREFLAPFTRPDRFAAIRPDLRYPICSLYLDTDDMRLYQQTVGGEKNRFKLRIRTYSDRDSALAFFEVKRKINNIVRKRRARIDRASASDILHFRNGDDLDRLPPDTRADLEYFSHHMSLSQAKPVIKIRYMREAYESKAGDPIRITLDTELMHAITMDDDLSHSHGRWVRTPVDGVIVEIKFTNNFPSWVHDFVCMFGLKQQPVPKYVWSIDHVMLHSREATLSLGGLTLPPRRA